MKYRMNTTTAPMRIAKKVTDGQRPEIAAVDGRRQRAGGRSSEASEASEAAEGGADRETATRFALLQGGHRAVLGAAAAGPAAQQGAARELRGGGRRATVLRTTTL